MKIYPIGHLVKTNPIQTQFKPNFTCPQRHALSRACPEEFKEIKEVSNNRNKRPKLARKEVKEALSRHALPNYQIKFDRVVAYFAVPKKAEESFKAQQE